MTSRAESPAISTTAGGSSPLKRLAAELHGVTPLRAKQLGDLGVQTLGDLLEYFPRDYHFESEELTISQLHEGIFTWPAEKWSPSTTPRAGRGRGLKRRSMTAPESLR